MFILFCELKYNTAIAFVTQVIPALAIGNSFTLGCVFLKIAILFQVLALFSDITGYFRLILYLPCQSLESVPPPTGCFLSLENSLETQAWSVDVLFTVGVGGGPSGQTARRCVCHLCIQTHPCVLAPAWCYTVIPALLSHSPGRDIHSLGGSVCPWLFCLQPQCTVRISPKLTRLCLLFLTPSV